MHEATLSRATLRSRYRITGRIVLDTALHIGTRSASTITDSPIIRDGQGHPFIPGSSLKGAFRAATERIVPNLGLTTCALSDSSDACASRVREATRDRELGEQEMLNLLDGSLCDTCRTFGAAHLVGVTLFHDAPVSEMWRAVSQVPTQIRDGVGVDRDSERARGGIKFDFEVVPPQVAFDFTLGLENPLPRDLAIVAVGLQEFIGGMIPLGGIRTRGLGQCHLEAVKVAFVDFSDPQALQRYLLAGEWGEQSAEEFARAHLRALPGWEVGNV